jgi:hypothetical protein
MVTRIPSMGASGSICELAGTPSKTATKAARTKVLQIDSEKGEEIMAM